MNGSRLDIEIQLDYVKSYPIPSGGILNLSNLRYEGFNVKNMSSAAALGADLVIITAEVEVT